MSFTVSSVVESPLEETFTWHERPGAIERLVAPFQGVRVAAEAEHLAGGTAVLRLPGGLRWVAQHEGYDPPNAFTDCLTSLPFRWRHTHRFEAVDASRTLVTDEVDTQVPEGMVRSMFEYRHRQLADDLRTQQAMRRLAPAPLRIGVTGASGLIGRSLCALLTTGGHRVVRYVRRAPARPDERQWDPDHPDPAAFEGIDAVVHLAGASIAGRFGAAHKDAIRRSRVGPTAELVAALAEASDGPSTLVSASAIGIYGPDRGDEWLDEGSGQGGGFLADVVAAWEQAAAAAQAGIRSVQIRTGIVQSAGGGALRLQRPLFAAGLGGRVGSGRQWISWIDVDDVADVYFRAIVDERCRGPVNAVSPNPVTSQDYARTLARVLRRPALLPVPGAALDVVLGREGASEVALASQRVEPHVLAELGHSFRRPTLEECLRHQLGKFVPLRAPVEAGVAA